MKIPTWPCIGTGMPLSHDSPLLPWKASGTLEGGYPFLTATLREGVPKKILRRLQDAFFTGTFPEKDPPPPTPNKKFLTVPKPNP